MSSLLPLEQRMIPVANKNGLNKDAPAVHKLWSEARTWTRWRPSPDQEEAAIPGAEDSWLTTARRIGSELSWLLRIPCNVFWSQMCHDHNLQRWLADIMESFPREHDKDPSWSAEVARAHQDVLHRLFLVHVRLCTHKESASDFFSPEHWGAMLYEKYLLELPRILDMCVLFSSCNRAITSKMIGNVFRHQPQYNNDLVECVMTIMAALDAATEQNMLLSISQPSLDTLEPLTDLTSYCVDISVTLASLVSILPASASVMHNTGLDVRLATYYTSVVTPLVSLVTKYQASGVMSDGEAEGHVTRISITRHNIITCIREIICQMCFADNVPAAERLESFFTVMSSLMSEIGFLTDYNELFSIRAEFELFEKENILVDSVRKAYILDMFNSTQSSSFMAGNSIQKSEPVPSSSQSGSHHDDPEMLGACAAVARPSAVEVSSLVTGVRDLLPHLGEGYVECVLVEFGFKVDETINALLEGNLPKHLQDLDPSLSKDLLHAKKPEPEPEPVMRSIYDGDEFDVFSRDNVDLSKVHRGKRNKTTDAKKLLEDKRDVMKMKDRFDRLGIVEDIEVIEVLKRSDREPQPGNDYDYDDEYDDTYDDVPLGEQEPDAKDDLGRGFVLPVALGGGKITHGRNNRDEEDDDDEEEEEKSRTKMNFVRNPEEVREEMARKRQEKIGRRGGGGGGRGGGGGGGQNRDVVGKARGQGQDKQVLINRARKNANKGKGQRAGADRKAAKGMF